MAKWLVFALAVGLVACGSGDGTTQTSAPVGTESASGGGSPEQDSGVIETGGSSSTGGATASGGATATGGASSSGGVTASGGTLATGGTTATAGGFGGGFGAAPGSGGGTATGGAPVEPAAIWKADAPLPPKFCKTATEQQVEVKITRLADPSAPCLVLSAIVPCSANTWTFELGKTDALCLSEPADINVEWSYPDPPGVMYASTLLHQPATPTAPVRSVRIVIAYGRQYWSLR